MQRTRGRRPAGRVSAATAGSGAGARLGMERISQIYTVQYIVSTTFLSAAPPHLSMAGVAGVSALSILLSRNVLITRSRSELRVRTQTSNKAKQTH